MMASPPRIPLRRADWGAREAAALLGGLRPGQARTLADIWPANTPNPYGQALLLRSGRQALLLALSLADSDKPRVVIPSFLCRAVADAILAAGKQPRFVDIGDDLNVTAQAVEQALDDTVSAVIVPHMFGKPAQIDQIEALCRRRGVLLIDDAAAAMGIQHAGRPLGSFGQAGIFSFAQQKSLTAGQGGALVAPAQTLERLAGQLTGRPLSGIGLFREAAWWMWEYPIHYRWPRLRASLARRLGLGPAKLLSQPCQPMPGRYAAALAVQVRRMDRILQTRQENCRMLQERLGQIAGLAIPQYYAFCQLTRLIVRISGLRWPAAALSGTAEKGNGHPLARRLAELGIESARTYLPLHMHADLASFADRALPATEQLVPELVALPTLGRLSQRDCDAIASAIGEFCRAGSAAAAAPPPIVPPLATGSTARLQRAGQVEQPVGARAGSDTSPSGAHP